MIMIILIMITIILIMIMINLIMITIILTLLWFRVCSGGGPSPVKERSEENNEGLVEVETHDGAGCQRTPRELISQLCRSVLYIGPWELGHVHL